MVIDIPALLIVMILGENGHSHISNKVPFPSMEMCLAASNATRPRIEGGDMQAGMSIFCVPRNDASCLPAQHFENIFKYPIVKQPKHQPITCSEFGEWDWQ